MKKTNSFSSRRGFLTNAAAFTAAAAMPKISFASPNDRLKVAFIGTGGRGGSNLQSVAKTQTIDVVGLCDVDSRFLTSAGDKFPKAQKFEDFRKLYDTKLGDNTFIETADFEQKWTSSNPLQCSKTLSLKNPN